MAQRVGRGIALLFHDRGTRRCEWSAACPGRNLSPGKTRYPLYRRLDGPQGRTGRAENLVPTGIRSRTVQPVVSRYRLSYLAHIYINYKYTKHEEKLIFINYTKLQWRTQEFCSGGGGSTNSVEDRGQRKRGSGGGSPLVRGSEGSCNLVKEISFHIVKFS